MVGPVPLTLLELIPRFPLGRCKIPTALAQRFLTYVAQNNASSKFAALELCNAHPDLPSWWEPNANLLFLPATQREENIPKIQIHPGLPEPQNVCLILNGKATYSLMLWGNGGVIYLSDQSDLANAHLALGGGGIFVGNGVRATARLTINCRNQGIVALDEDILIGSDVKFMTDDCHTIISTNDGRRLNPFGGVIQIGKHVWIADEVRIMGDSSIQRDCIIGAGAFVRRTFDQAGIVLAGVPAKVIRENVTWDHRDLPPQTPLENKVSTEPKKEC
jgi:acetyltransferase-like isoleucine patch superfamily enzyme